MEYRKRNIYKESSFENILNFDYEINNYKIIKIPESQVIYKYLSGTDFSARDIRDYGKEGDVYFIIVTYTSYKSIIIKSIDLINWYKDEIDYIAHYKYFYESEVEDIFYLEFDDAILAIDDRDVKSTEIFAIKCK